MKCKHELMLIYDRNEIYHILVSTLRLASFNWVYENSPEHEFGYFGWVKNETAMIDTFQNLFVIAVNKIVCIFQYNSIFGA